jgi:hypothetical protein
LGDIDVDNNGIFTSFDIFGTEDIQSATKFTNEWDTAKQALVKKAESNKELMSILESFKVNGKTLYEILKMNVDDLKDSEIELE